MDLLHTISDTINPGVVRRTSDFLGEHDRNTWTAIEQLIPTATAATINFVSTYGGAQQFEYLMEHGRHEGKRLAELSSLLSNRISAFSLFSFGERFVEKIFGPNAIPVAEVVAEENGIARDSALELLNLTTLVLVEILGHEKTSARFSPIDIPQLLLSQRRNAARALPAEIARYVELYDNPALDMPASGVPQKISLLMLKLQRLFS